MGTLLLRRQHKRHNGRHYYCFLALWVVAVSLVGHADAWQDAAADFLARGDAALLEKKLDHSIELYNEGIQLLPQSWSGKVEDGLDEESTARDAQFQLPNEAEMSLIISMHTNLGTALSYLNGSTENVLAAYRTACLCYRQWKKQMEAQSENNDVAVPKDIKNIASQSYFFLGMTYQDLASATVDKEQQQHQLQNAARSYAAATRIDPNHWSSFANMAVVLGDVGENAISLELYEEGIMSYQRAIDILTGVRGEDDGDDDGPTDPPENVREVVSELHYRIGLCLVPFLFDPNKDNEDHSEQQCTLNLGPKSTPTTRSCLELSAYRFNTALQFHPDHEGANSALTIATADAVFGMSTDVKKVQNLFEDYAPTFEHSLVQELGYNGFQRMREGFDRAMLAEGKGDIQFPLVIDAGCGTGLAGEVVSQCFI